MSLLTIAIPTYNRSVKLDQQMRFLSNEMRECGDGVKIAIFDNASTDKTPEVCARWLRELGDQRLTVTRNPVNHGIVKNYRLCLGSRTDGFVWALSDDDRVHQGLVPRIFSLLKADPQTALLASNFQHVRADDGTFLYGAIYVTPQGGLDENPAYSVFETCVLQDRGGLMFISSVVIRADLAQAALAAWTGDESNLALPLYVAGYACSQGRARILSEVGVDCAIGHQSWAHLAPRLFYFDSVQVLYKLRFEGFSKRFIRHAIWRHWAGNWRTRIRFLRRFPRLAFRAVGLYFRAIWVW